MPLETVIGKNAPHVGMAGEQHAVEIVGLALEPVGAAKHIDQRRNGRDFVGRAFDTDALVQPWRQEMIDDVEALLARRPVDRGDVDDADELAGRVVAQEGRDLDDVGGVRRQRQFAVGDFIAKDRAGQRGLDRSSKPVEHI